MEIWIQIVGNVIQVISIIVGAWLVAIQIRKNHESSIEVQRENARLGLKVKVYEDFECFLNTAQERITIIDSVARSLPFSIYFYWRRKEEFKLKEPTHINHTSYSIARLHNRAMDSALKLIIKLESFEVALTESKTFVRALSIQMSKCSDAFREFHEATLMLLPVHVPKDKQAAVGSKILEPHRPTDDNLNRIKKASEEYNEVLMDLQAFVYDLRVEAQNLLLGELFQKRVPPRKPIDPRHLVLSSHPEVLAKLLAHVEHEEKISMEKYQNNTKLLEAKGKQSPTT
ncbi:MAG: hypothetical protein HY291_06065 [Planctomycetes bacterium]|nr:hypothetical protein [Planctomycetota bacterium]